MPVEYSGGTPLATSPPLPLPRTLALTPAHIARVQRPNDDVSAPPGRVQMTEADYDAIRDRLLATRPAEAGDALWIFAYASLIWKPASAVAEQRPALLKGWHRKFCFRIERYRACEERPGLMMALDRGGACRGVIQRLVPDCPVACLDQLLRREHSYKPSSHRAQWVTVETEGRRRVPAIAFVIDRTMPTYLGDLTLEQQAEMIAFACGNVGACAEYLMHTVDHLEQLGIHDRYLWRLQELVAARIGTMD